MQLYLAAAAVCGVCFLALLGLIARRYARGKPMPPANAWIGYVAGLYAWLFILYTSPVVLLFVRCGMPFSICCSCGSTRREGPEPRRDRDGVPDLLGRLHRLRHRVGRGPVPLGAALPRLAPPLRCRAVRPTLFMALFALFINIHHYFIDNAIWRKDNPEMRYLFE